MTTKELLEVCRYADREIAAIDLLISRLGPAGVKRGASSQALRGMLPGLWRPDAALSKKIDAYEQMLKKKRQAISDLLMQFDKLLEKMPDMKDRDMLRYHYRTGWSDERIAEEMELTDRTVRARRKKVLLLS